MWLPSRRPLIAFAMQPRRTQLNCALLGIEIRESAWETAQSRLEPNVALTECQRNSISLSLCPGKLASELWKITQRNESGLV